ncbi:RNA polymerase sigma factor [Nocardioides sp.]|uniref:RNA polymerase sigma factor n=1 Tax=Nocardioides sp. TaxID=35761 RepID=UPI00356998E3
MNLSTTAVLAASRTVLLNGTPRSAATWGEAADATSRGVVGDRTVQSSAEADAVTHARGGTPLAELSVPELVDLAKDGDLDAFGELYRLHRSSIHRLVKSYTSSSSTADDLTSETFVRALRAIGDFKTEGEHFGAWLRKIARNLVADHYRAKHQRLELCTDDVYRHVGRVGRLDRSVAPASESMDHVDLDAALAGLPPNQRRCITLRFLAQVNLAETADLLGCTIGAAKQLQWRALRNLARLMSEEAVA